MDELVSEFLIESYENLDQLDREFVELEKSPDSRETLAGVFRTIHTIKGTCGFLGFSKLERVTHVGENLLSLLRDGKLDLTPEITSALLSMVDTVRELLSEIESTQSEGDRNYDDLIRLLSDLRGGAAQEEEGAGGEAASDPAPATQGEEAAEAEPASAPEAPDTAEVAKAPDTAEAVADEAKTTEAASEPAHAEPAAEPAAAKPEPKAQPAEARPAPAARAGGRGVSDSSIRVDVRLLDNLMNMVGELVLARNQIVQSDAVQADRSLAEASQRLNLIASELQEGVMKTRMQPIGNVWNRFPRVVRDLAVTCGKEVRIEMEGRETELDKSLLEAIGDPLTHVVRNSVDHGIESPDVREAAGKPREGCLKLLAYHEGGQVNIEIRDDGGGIDPERIGKKAIERGLMTPEQIARMGDQEIVALIFAPGFSTAEKVTNVSGRGVGMDVVKTNIEKIGGTVDIHSTLGEGTSLKIKIPLTLAIIPALIVGCAENHYAIPQISLHEVVRIEAGEIESKIERIRGAAVYRLRGNLLPLVYLSDIMGTAEVQEGATYIVVLHAEDRHFGLVVNEICDTQEIVVKPLGKLLQGIPFFAGATIMGDGRVALILDVLGMAHASQMISGERERIVREQQEADDLKTGTSKSLLLFSGGGDRQLATELSLVARLEEFEASAIESAGHGRVVQYRGQILPVHHVSECMDLGLPPSCWGSDPDEMLEVIVYTRGKHSVGLVVDEILDIAKEVVADDNGFGGVVTGSTVIKDRVTTLVDLDRLVQSINPNFAEMSEVL